jgi:hypothetical protein
MNRFTRIILLLLLLTATQALAGSLTPPGAPDAGSGMPTTAEIYNRLDTGADIAAPGAFKEPTAGPTAGTGRTLAEIQGKLPVADNTNGATAAQVQAGKSFWGLRTDGTWGVKTGTYTPAHLKLVNKTGQTQCWDSAGTLLASCVGTGMDGEYQYGIDPAIVPTDGTTGAYNTPASTGSRFIDNGDGTVTDALTALIWLKNANCFGTKAWSAALTSANTLKGDNTQCGLNDGSSAGQWRLPNVNELHSMGPTWPPGAPFTGVQATGYWSSSSYAGSTGGAWSVFVSDGYVGGGNKVFGNYVWPVRGGQ